MEVTIRVANGGMEPKIEGGSRPLGSPRPTNCRGSCGGFDRGWVRIQGEHFEGTRGRTAHRVHLPKFRGGAIVSTERGAGWGPS